jgi:hypothetical protein
MDVILNGIFFKCCFCKVLMKIVNRESISPDHDSRFLKGVLENEIKGLFHPTANVQNNTPFRNLFGGTNCSSTNNLLGFNSFIPADNNINQNLLPDFNKMKPSNNFFQTPKNNKVNDTSFFFSPEQMKDVNFQTPKNMHSGN